MGTTKRVLFLCTEIKAAFAANPRATLIRSRC